MGNRTKRLPPLTVFNSRLWDQDERPCNLKSKPLVQIRKACWCFSCWKQHVHPPPVACLHVPFSTFILFLTCISFLILLGPDHHPFTVSLLLLLLLVYNFPPITFPLLLVTVSSSMSEWYNWDNTTTIIIILRVLLLRARFHLHGPL